MGFSVGRWKGREAAEIRNLETLIGQLLLALGYPVMPVGSRRIDLKFMRMRISYRTRFSSRHWLKSETLLGRISSTSVLHEPVF